MVVMTSVKISALPSVALTDRLRVSECSAVYFILDADNRTLYVGSTAHLKTRLGCHRVVKGSPENGAVRVAWMLCDWRLGMKYEADLIFALQPPLNVRGKRWKLALDIPPNSGGIYDSPDWVWKALGMDVPRPPAPPASD